jgi:hypothetical protein
MQPDDPRLSLVELPPGWSKHEHELMYLETLYVNEETGEEPTDRDPRLTGSALRERGVDLKVFEII